MAGNGKPPSPRLPRIAQFWLLWLKTIPYLEWCHRRIGDTFTTWSPPFGDLVYVADPAEIKRIFTGAADDFHAGEANALVLEPVVGKHSLLVLDEEEHLRERKLLLPHFHGESVRRYADVIAEVAAAEVDSWPVGERVQMRPAMQRISLEVILRAVIGVSDPRRLAGLRDLLPRAGALTPVIQAMWMWPGLGRVGPWRRYRKVLEDTDTLLFEEIAERRRDPSLAERTDILSLLIANGSFTDQALRDEVMTLLTAGHETTATGLSWAFERLTRHPAAMERRDDEWLDAVVKETLRVRPVIVDAVRRVTRPTEVGGYTVPAGTILLPAVAVVQRDRRHYGADALAFRPERWLDGGSAPYTWIPFGGGVRRCIGAAFATLEMKVVLRTVLERVELGPGRAGDEGARMSGVMVLPRHGGQVVVRRRVGSPGRQLASVA